MAEIIGRAAPPASVRILRLGDRDIQRLRRLNALFADAFEDPGSYAGALPDDAYLEGLLAKQHIIVLVAEERDAIVGGLVAIEIDKWEQARREIYIYDLAVSADRRREGIATALIGRLQLLAVDRGAPVIFVQADDGDEPAIALYASLGTRKDVMHFDIPVTVGAR